jgi:hypothetical protein
MSPEKFNIFLYFANWSIFTQYIASKFSHWMSGREYAVFVRRGPIEA